jgi:hypothetical protein
MSRARRGLRGLVACALAMVGLVVGSSSAWGAPSGPKAASVDTELTAGSPRALGTGDTTLLDDVTPVRGTTAWPSWLAVAAVIGSIVGLPTLSRLGGRADRAASSIGPGAFWVALGRAPPAARLISP